MVDRGRRLGEVRLQIPGRHYVLDALAALAAGLGLGFSFADLARGLGSFSGTRRRMELKGEAGGIRVYDSYAHHPNEIAGDLQAARSLAGEGRVVVAFQPHMVSRTKIFGAAMGRALGAADEVVVMDVYVAREDPEPGVSGALVADAVPLPPEAVVFEPRYASTAAHLVERARPGDVVLTLGAGDVTLLAPEVLAQLVDLHHGRRCPMTSLMSRPGSSGEPDEETIALERKLFRKRRRWGRLRRMRPWLGALLALVLLVAGAYGRVVLAAPGHRGGRRHGHPGRSRRSWSARPHRCRSVQPLARLDLDAVRGRVASLPAVKSVRVTRAWPHGVAIAVTERVAVAVVPRAGGFRGLAADGVLFRTYDARPPGLPVIRDQQGADTAALREAARVVGSLPPAVLARVDHVSVAHHRRDPAGDAQRSAREVGRLRTVREEGRGARGPDAPEVLDDRRAGARPAHDASLGER